ncbi:hypothetical protein MAPG_05980 [Magnaporthiopsis poae ATCC 64411]|uniref:Heterokaryon incompatibility domain-containing protein n=1 Tax=Magnaporthiopsis poae (strain ATCC 64411 / 73-15) TaxID=644358 RepID=A0A0C4E0U3_MAGP6|nr:hypothetical protein MAPG_05980 [Magnaporthiopsis poae ATCC 64411]
MPFYIYQYEDIDLATDATRLALSYVWGNKSRLSDIYINGWKHQVTLNLYDALLALRQPNQDRLLWIDATCINQRNHDERGHQVQRMKLIYHWSLLGRVIKNAQSVWRAAFLDPETQTNSRPSRFGREHQRALQDLMLEQPWLRRVWILQEAASAKSALIQCGTKSVHSRTFAMVPLLAGMDVPSHVNAVLDVMPGPRSTAWCSRGHKLEELLLQFRDKEAGDPQDRVYALIGMSADARDRPMANYNFSLQDTIKAAAIFMFCPHNSQVEANILPNKNKLAQKKPSHHK